MRHFLTLITLLAAIPAPCLTQVARPSQDAVWWSGAVCYEVFVRSFDDSDGDGIGDLRGLIERLDYINDGDPASQRDLGASCIWLMPISPSPSYHGYDITNYYDINREYGTMADFRRLVSEAHRRGIRILVDLVLNHVSSEHPYFKSALLDARSPYRDWFQWSPTQRRTRGWSVPTWHKVPARDEWYYGLFWQGMPDLNLANPAVTAEAQRIARFWLADVGVDGFRLDAVGHFFEDGEEPRNHPRGQAWLRDYAAAIRGIRADAFTIGEVWESMETTRGYYPDQLTAYFAFEAADSLVSAVRSGNGRGLIAMLDRMQRAFPAGRWGSFQRNHDQTRTMTEYAGDGARARLSATLLLTLPGIPFVYYGEEIGMTGSKQQGDPRLRTPMHWRRAPAAGFTRGLPWEPLASDSLTANVELMDPDEGSLLNHYRRLIHLRGRTPALGAAAEFIPFDTGNDAMLAFARREGGSVAVVVANLGDRRTTVPGLISAGGLLAAGSYTAQVLVGTVNAAPLRVRQDGRILGWVPVPSLGPLEAVVLELQSR